MTTRQAQRRHELGNPISGHGVTNPPIRLHDHHQPNGALNMTTPNTKKSAATAAQAESPIWSQVEQLSLKLAALEVLLFNATGEACDSFNALDEEQREVYLSHCADMATAAKAEAKRITHAALAVSRGATATA